MKKTNFRIDMDLVRKIIKDKGFYFIKAERLFDDHYSGPAFYIVTDKPEFKCNDSRFADAVILTTTQFEPIAEIVNEELKQNDKDRKRKYVDLDEDEINSIFFEDTFDKVLLNEAIETLKPLHQKRLILYFFKGMNMAEIAEMQNVSIRAISYSIKKSITALREYFVNNNKIPS